jgi:heme oxygenase (mycobilin-producing)
MSVVLINSFEVPAGREADFSAAWHDSAQFMAKQPGYISTRLHRALAGDARYRFVNVAEWASEQDCRTAVAAPGFREAARGLAEFPGLPAFYDVVYADHAG